MKKEFEKLKNKFEEHGYSLTPEEITEIKKQLDKRPIQVYFLAFKFMIKHKETVTYKQIAHLLRVSIKIRDHVKKIIIPVEESVRVMYFKAEIETSDLQHFEKVTRKSYKKVVKRMGKNDHKLYDEIKFLRKFLNDFSYPLISKDLKDIIDSLHAIKKIDLVDPIRVQKYISMIYKANHGIELNSVAKIFEQIKSEYR